MVQRYRGFESEGEVHQARVNLKLSSVTRLSRCVLQVTPLDDPPAPRYAADDARQLEEEQQGRNHDLSSSGFVDLSMETAQQTLAKQLAADAAMKQLLGKQLLATPLCLLLL